jgi:YYY domain-containing protein
MAGPIAPSRRRRALVLAMVMVLAASLRLTGLDWDQRHHLHPDERFLTMVANDVRIPESFGQYLDARQSSINPTNVGRAYFTYGTLPLVLTRVTAETLGLADYDRLQLVGRGLSTLFDLGSIWLAYLIGLRLSGWRAAIVASTLLALSVISIQQSHYFTVDSPATFFATLSIWFLTRIVAGGRLWPHVMFGIAGALTLACRINLVLLAALYPVAVFIAWRLHATAWRAMLAWSMLAVTAAAVTFRIALPYAFAGSGLATFALAPEFMQSMSTIAGFSFGAADFPPSVQWVGRLPIVFPGWNLFFWGLGPAFGAAALVAVGWMLVQWRSSRDHRQYAMLVVALWVVLLFVFHATQFVATLRYFLPIVPALAVAAGVFLAHARWRPRPATLATIAILVGTAVWALAFTSIYRRPPTRVEASRWIFENVQPGQSIASEHWDDALPLSVGGRTTSDYRNLQLKLYDEESEAKRQELLTTLDQADVVVLSSNRLYRSIPREPWRYPLARRYYELLFSGQLGFDLAQVFTSYPRLGPLEFDDDDAEEAFTVYDHPKVLIFRKTAAYDRSRTAALLNEVSLSSIIRVPPREASALFRRFQPSELTTPDESAVRQASAPVTMASGEAAIRWALALQLASFAIFCLLNPLLNHTADEGYGLAKVMAWLAPGTLLWLLASSGVVGSNAASARGAWMAIIAAGAGAAWYRWRALIELFHSAAFRRHVVTVEALWLTVALVFTAIRVFSPAIYWGEKPMDFAIVNALLRSPTMPPADPWFAGEKLNYFYFGHALTAAVTMISGVPAAMAFNLAIPTVAALLATAAYLTIHQVTGRRLPATVGAAALVGLGNLAGLQPLVTGAVRLNFDYFWATSRVIPGTINEYPFWNLVFADLHSHVLAMPLEVTLIYFGSLWCQPSLMSRTRDAVLIVLTGWVLGAVAITSSWSTPTMVLLQLGFVVTAWRVRGGGSKTAVLALGAWLGMLLIARVLFWPFWSHFVPPPRTWGWTIEVSPLTGMLTMFGTFLLVIVPALVLRIRVSRLLTGTAILAGCIGLAVWRSPTCAAFGALFIAGAILWWTARDVSTRIAALLVACAGGVGAGTEIVFVWDRMNTVFKFYLEIWLMLGCAAAVFAWLGASHLRRPVRMMTAAVVSIAVAAGAWTSISAASGFLREPRAASPVPTLNGLAYLESDPVSEWPAFAWMNRRVRGIPVVLEAHGPSYQSFARVSMNTGLPTVVGWQYHLTQQSRPQQEIEARAADVKDIYDTTSRERAEQLLRRYRVDLIVVGTLERQTYSREGLAKFENWPFLRRALSAPGVTVYATPGGNDLVKTWVEKIPPSLSSPNLKEARGAAVAPDGSIFVADFGNRRIRHYDGNLGLLGEFGVEGIGPTEFRDPCAVAVDADGMVWVADTWNHRIQKLSAEGNQLAEWRAELYGPRGIAVARDGSVLVTDTGNSRVLRFDAGGTPTPIAGRDLLDGPVGIAIGPHNEIYVADAGHRRVVVLAMDGTVQQTWPVPEWARGAASEPYVAVGTDGVVWVSDPDGGQVLLFAPSGLRIGPATASEPLRQPRGIALVDQRTAVVVDSTTNRLIRVSRPQAGRP